LIAKWRILLIATSLILYQVMIFSFLGVACFLFVLDLECLVFRLDRQDLSYYCRTDQSCNINTEDHWGRFKTCISISLHLLWRLKHKEVLMPRLCRQREPLLSCL